MTEHRNDLEQPVGFPVPDWMPPPRPAIPSIVPTSTSNGSSAPSRAAALRLRFSFEGIFRQSTVAKGRNRHTAWYSGIDREWPELKAAFVAWLDPSNFDADGRQRARLSDLTAGALRRCGQ